MSLRTKFLRSILPPLIIGISITSMVALGFLLNFYVSIINDAKHSILLQEYTSIKSISDSLSLSLREYFLLKLTYLEALVNYSETLLDDKNNIKFTIDNVTALNAYLIANGSINITNEMDYDASLYNCYDYSMWFLNQNITDIASLSSDSKDRLVFATHLEFEMVSIYKTVNARTPGLMRIYVLFMDDGLQFIYPSAQRMRYTNYTKENSCPYSSNTSRIDYYDLRCTDQMQGGFWFLLSENVTINTTMFVSKPFILMETMEVGITLCSAHFKNSTSSNFSKIPKKDRILDYLICGEFFLENITNLYENADSPYQGHYYVLDRFNNLMYHTNFTYINDNRPYDIKSITEYEFNVSDSLNNTFAYQFNQTIFPLNMWFFSQNQDLYTFQNQLNQISYKGKDGDYMGTMSPIFFPITASDENYHGANLFFIEPSGVVMKPFDNIVSGIYKMITIQSVGLFILILILSWIGFRLINYLVNSIITPLTDLSEVVMKMLNDDLDTDVTRNYTPNSEEITQLYQSFSKLKFVMKYANAEFFSGNDAQALINYSNALKLYEEINNKDGVGMTYNNIGNIHLKNKRYEEAIIYYKKAVEVIENDLNAFYKDTSFFRESLKFKDKTLNNSKKPLFLRSRRNYKSHKTTEEQREIDDATLNKMNDLYSNRLFQLGLTLYTQIFTNNHEEDLQEVIDIFDKVIQIDSFLGTNPARTIQALIFISNCYLELGNHLASLKYLNEAESSVFLYETAQNMLQIDNKITKKIKEKDDKELNTDLEFFSTNSMQFHIKSDILKQLWMYHSALFCKKMGKFKQACFIYTRALETGKIYDPLIRKKCLEDMSFILASQGLLSKAPNITTILSRLDSFKGKEIVFLLDVSESMGEGARLKYAIRNFLKIFDKFVRGDDKVCFIRFNYMCEVVFNLTPKKNNTIQLRRQIEATNQTKGGTAFFDSIASAIAEFDKLRRITVDDGSSNMNSYWIVSLTDGEDNCSKISAEAIKQKLKQRGINLIIIGLGLSPENVANLSELCKATKDGVFIETPNNDDLDIAFEAISEIIYGPNFIVETFSFS